MLLHWYIQGDIMKKLFILGMIIFATMILESTQPPIEEDILMTTMGKLKIYFIGHGSLRFEINNKNIYVDPWSKLTDYSKMPKADIILLTHEHPDHLDKVAIEKLSKSVTEKWMPKSTFDILKKGAIMKNGDVKTLYDITVEAVPAYNTNKDKEQFHPKGRDNGYIITIGKTRIYIAGDTENIPEMEKLKNIDIAFLPMNQPYTMTPEQVADAAKKIAPTILYPYHTGETDVTKLYPFMVGNNVTEVRIRSMK